MAVSKLTLYTSTASQWAQVGHLGLEEKGYKEGEYNIKQVDLFTGENFSPEYLNINPNGTVPSLEYPSQTRALVDSREVLEHLDSTRSGESIPTLAPSDPKTAAVMAELIELVHGDDVSTNIPLLQCRDLDEYNDKKGGFAAKFLQNRQHALEALLAEYPNSSFYAARAKSNGVLNNIYQAKPGAELEAFFKSTHEDTRRYAVGFDRLERTLVLPYAAGGTITLADLHIVPWMSHAQMAVGSTDINDLDTLEKHFQKTAPDFKIGPKMRSWWKTMGERESFQKIYPKPH